MARLSEIMQKEKITPSPLIEPISPIPITEKRPIGATVEFPKVPKKPIYEQIPIEEFPKLGTFQDIAGQFGTAFLNQFLGQLPEAILRKKGYELPQPVTTPGQISEIVGGVSGALLGVPTKVAGITARATRALPRVARWGISGAAAGAVVTPKTEEGEILLPKRRLFQAALSGGLGALGGLTANIARNIRNIKDPTRLADKVRDTIIKIRRKASSDFGKALNVLQEKYPTKTVNLKDQIDVLVEEVKEYPKLKSIIKRIPKLTKLMDDPELSKNITLEESQNILNSLKSKISLTKLAGRNIRPDDLPFLDFIDDVRYQQIEAFPEMTEVKANYANILQRYNIIKKDLKIGNLLTAMETRWFKPEIKREIDKFLPKEIIKEIGGYKKAATFIKNLKTISKTIAFTGITGAALGYGFFRGARD